VNCDQRSAAWFAARLGKATASKIADVTAKTKGGYSTSRKNYAAQLVAVNKVQLIGRLGADPESRSLNNGGKVVNLRLATSESWKNQSGERQERTEWHQNRDLQRRAGKVAETISEGLAMLHRGPLQTRKWTDQSGRSLLDGDRVAEVSRRAGAAGRTLCWRCGQLAGSHQAALQPATKRLPRPMHGSGSGVASSRSSAARMSARGRFAPAITTRGATRAWEPRFPTMPQCRCATRHMPNRPIN
jgi:single-stranded DNA-binding protein